jgi:hypothetical protein
MHADPFRHMGQKDEAQLPQTVIAAGGKSNLKGWVAYRDPDRI